jgi:hypothetical protein
MRVSPSRNAVFGQKMTVSKAPISGFKSLDRAKEQGALRQKSGAYTVVREHFLPECNAAIWCEMNF